MEPVPVSRQVLDHFLDHGQTRVGRGLLRLIRRVQSQSPAACGSRPQDACLESALGFGVSSHEAHRLVRRVADHCDISSAQAADMLIDLLAQQLTRGIR